MSGIVGIYNIDGAPADRQLLQRLTDSLAFRGPDATGVWSCGSVGFGHTLLHMADRATKESQPVSLDGRVWITADVRLDGRKELVEKLVRAGRQTELSRPDAELLLHAYQVWGEGLVDHILGDFCFAIWDSGNKSLFCARDQMGMRPFYYALTGNSFIFSNTLNCLRRHPGISARLNDQAIADFLLFDSNQDMSTTSLADIFRLPPAHMLRRDSDTFTVRRYWTLPEKGPVHFKHPQECLEQFRTVLDAAVGDRLLSNAACISLSGGLDSPTVAASARRVLERRGSSFDLWAHTIVYRHAIPHEEEHYSGLAAEALQIDRRLGIGDQDRIYGNYADPNFSTPEPTHSPMGWTGGNPLPAIAQRGRVMFTGMGADPVLASLRSSHIRGRIQKKEFGRLARDLTTYFAAKGRFSRLYLRMNWQRWLKPRAFEDSYPSWINPDLERRLDLRARWNDIDSVSNVESNQSVRPEAYAAVLSPRWIPLFEAADGGCTRFPIEVRHPFFDLRVMEFLLALPALPWCSDKQILREAGRGVLPDEVRLRVKSPMIADPILAALGRPESEWVDKFVPAPNLDSYVVRERIPSLVAAPSTTLAWVHLRPLSLNYWLQGEQRLGYQQ